MADRRPRLALSACCVLADLVPKMTRFQLLPPPRPPDSPGDAQCPGFPPPPRQMPMARYGPANSPTLAAKARDILAGVGLGNAPVAAAPATEGYPPNAPYDVIVFNGATEVPPDLLYRQLNEGGRLVGVFAMTQPPRATIVTRSHGDFGNRALFDAAAPVLPGLRRVPAFVF